MHLRDAPADRFEKGDAILRRKFQRRVCKSGAHALTQHRKYCRGTEVENPAANAGLSANISRQGAHLSVIQIYKQSLRENKRLSGGPQSILQGRDASSGISQIDFKSAKLAAWYGIGEQRFLLLDQGRQIDFDPSQCFREFETIRARVEAGRQIDDAIAALRDFFLDELINELGTGDHGPAATCLCRHQFGDSLSALASQRFRVRVMEQCVRSR